MFNYGDIIEYIDGTYDENFNNARSWALANNATFNEIIDKRQEIEGVLHRFYEIKEIIIPEPKKPNYEEVKATRAFLYSSQVDHLMSEYTRKKTFNLFEEGEEVELLAEIEKRVAEIKENNPYPVVDIITSEHNETTEN